MVLADGITDHTMRPGKPQKKQQAAMLDRGNKEEQQGIAERELRLVILVEAHKTAQHGATRGKAASSFLLETSKSCGKQLGASKAGLYNTP